MLMMVVRVSSSGQLWNRVHIFSNRHYDWLNFYGGLYNLINCCCGSMWVKMPNGSSSSSFWVVKEVSSIFLHSSSYSLLTLISFLISFFSLTLSFAYTCSLRISPLHPQNHLHVSWFTCPQHAFNRLPKYSTPPSPSYSWLIIVYPLYFILYKYLDMILSTEPCCNKCLIMTPLGLQLAMSRINGLIFSEYYLMGNIWISLGIRFISTIVVRTYGVFFSK